MIHHLNPQFGITHRAHLHTHAETIEQLRPQFALLRVAGADQHEAGWMAYGHALTFHRVPTRSSGIEQNIHQMVIQQVHLVHIKQAAVGLGQQAGFKGTHALAEGLLDVNRSAETVLRGSQRQIHHGHLAWFC